MNEKRKAFYEKLDTQLGEWSAQIDRLKVMGASAEAKFTSDCGKTLEALQHSHAEALGKLTELKAASDDAWDGLVAQLEKIQAKGTTAYHAVVSTPK
ncbi:MAG: hypothetical protein P4L36_10740 [Holophaga sp.]|nr:hypothetical protein [Holophaga sp.]